MYIKPYLQLLRPANLVTAVADILAGMAIAQYIFESPEGWWLVVATLGLYGGGVVLNDVFDARLDAVERPERPIPSGRTPLTNAVVLGAALLAGGVFSAVQYGVTSGWLALSIALTTLLYNRFAKHHILWGPLVMGMCRGGNLLLGISVAPEALEVWWPLGLIPVIYIAAVTLISRDEVYGGSRKKLYLAGLLYLTVHMVQLWLAFRQGNGLWALPLVMMHAGMIGLPWYRAVRKPAGPLIGKAVKAGVLALIVMNAAWCMVFGYPLAAAAVLLLLPVSLRLARIFAVT